MSKHKNIKTDMYGTYFQSQDNCPKTENIVPVQ